MLQSPSPNTATFPTSQLLDTGRFEPDNTDSFPGWAQFLNAGGLDAPAIPESEEYGIKHFVYRSKWPFHPERLYAALTSKDWAGVLRSKGFFWISSRPETQALWQQAGPAIGLEPTAPWLASIPREEWDLEPDELPFVEARWDPLLSDRMIELVFIGIDMDIDTIRKTLDACVITEAEVAGGFDEWAKYKTDGRY